MQYENFHGHRIAIASRQVYKDTVIRALKGNSCTRIVTINPEYIVLSHRNARLKQLTSELALVIPDGIGLTWALAARGHNVERYPGSEMIVDICDYARDHNLNIGIVIPQDSLSSRDEIIRTLQAKYPGIKCLVLAENEKTLEILRTATVDVLFVTFGQPRQDIWIAEHASELPNLRLAIGVGGSFDFLTGKRKRAPRVMRQLGVEWLWRLITQPQRLPRIFRATFGFWYVILTTP